MLAVSCHIGRSAHSSLGLAVLLNTHHPSKSHLAFAGSHSEGTAAVTFVSRKPGLVSGLEWARAWALTLTTHCPL